MKLLLECVALKKNYTLGKTEVEALRGIDLQIKEGDFLVLAGPSGSGKSTLLNLLGLIDSPDSGSLRFDSQDLANLKENKRAKLRKKEIGFVFQNFNLVPVLNALRKCRISTLAVECPGQKKGNR